MVLIRRPDLRYQLGFSVQNGIVSTGPDHFLMQGRSYCGVMLLPSFWLLKKSFYFVNRALKPVLVS